MRALAARWQSLAAASAFLLASHGPAFAQSPSTYERGVEARLAGEIDRAVELLAQAVAAEPRNADAQLQFGLALLAAGRLNEAESAFRTTLDLAPNYDDARIALARVHQRRGNRAQALTELDRVDAGNVEASELRAALMRPAAAQAAYRWRVDLDGSYSDVQRQQDWSDVSLRVAHSINAATMLGTAVESSRRFGEQDIYGEVRIDHRASARANLWIFAGGTPNADFRPRWQIGAGGAFKLSEGRSATVATIDARHSRYPSGDIQMLNPGVEQYLAGGHWLTARMINVVEDGNWHSGWVARADVMAAERIRLFAGVADAPDVTEGVVVETFSLFGGVAVDLSARTTFRLFVNGEKRHGSADRLEFGTGIGLRF